jgi:hypothetical protein
MRGRFSQAPAGDNGSLEVPIRPEALQQRFGGKHQHTTDLYYRFSVDAKLSGEPTFLASILGCETDQNNCGDS